MIDSKDYNPIVEAEFRAVTRLKIQHLHEEVRKLWMQSEKHQQAMQNISAKHQQAMQQISARINGTVLSAAALLASLLLNLIMTKVGL